MKSRIGNVLTVVLFVCLSVSVFSDGIQAGFAKVDITPPIGGKTSGYSSAKPTDGIHDPLFTKALVLKTDEQTIAIVSWDLCVFSSPALHQKKAELGLDQLIILNTHTHAGPNLRETDFPSEEKPWRATIEERVVEAIGKAKTNMFSAYFAANSGDIQLGYNRLVRQPGGFSITHFENPDRVPYGPVDPTVGVIRITDENGKIRLVLVCYACHPVVLGPKNKKISADFPGVLCREVQDTLGEGVECMFIQGGAGDINPLILARTGDPEMDFPLVERMGMLLAEETLETIEEMKDVKGKSKSLSCQSKVIHTSNRWEPEKDELVSVTSLLINEELGIMTMPGEPFHKFQFDLRKKADLPYTFLFGYADDAGFDWARYIPDLESAARGGYGASDTTIMAVGTGERIVNEGVVMLYQMRGRLLDEPKRHINK
jgi:neutral ceramidase